MLGGFSPVPVVILLLGLTMIVLGVRQLLGVGAGRDRDARMTRTGGLVVARVERSADGVAWSVPVVEWTAPSGRVRRGVPAHEATRTWPAVLHEGITVLYDPQDHDDWTLEGAPPVGTTRRGLGGTLVVLGLILTMVGGLGTGLEVLFALL